MKIVYVTDALAIWGGLERILVDKMNYLVNQAGDEVFLVTACQGSHPIPYTLSSRLHHHDLGVPLHEYYQYASIRRWLKRCALRKLFMKRFRNFLHENHVDVIVSVRIELTSLLASVKGSIPLVFESHSSCKADSFLNHSWRMKIKTFLFSRNARLADYVIALTEGDAAEWRKINPRVSVIPNVVHLNESGVYSDCTSKSVIFVGRFSAQKDIRSLLAVWRLVHASHPDWHLQIYGGFGEEQETLLPEIEHMEANVRVHAPTADILDRYRENSILLLTSRYEPFGLGLPEAMSCGLPVVAFDCPYGPADIVTDGEDGFLIPLGNIQMFAEKVCLLMDHPALRQQMGQAGIRSSQSYHPDNIMPLWKKFFEQECNVNKQM
jgi:glycosyltransferase involved in cell wall biosynthesis